MIIFLIPVRHEDGVQDYDYVWRLLNYTLGSVAAQDTQQWHAIVCANKVLPLSPSLPKDKITLIEYKRDFLGKSQPEFDEHDFQLHVVDKMLRRRKAIVHATPRLNPAHMDSTWYFMLDADDFVSFNLASTLIHRTRPEHTVATVDTGIVVDAHEGSFRISKCFNGICGTSVGIKADVMYKHINKNDHLCKMLGRHQFQDNLAFICDKSQRLSLKNMPYAAYLQHGENHGKFLWRTRQYEQPQSLNDDIRALFQIPEELT